MRCLPIVLALAFVAACSSTPTATDMATVTPKPDMVAIVVPPDMTVLPDLTPVTCTDGAKNGNETDVDCGGGACGKCADGLHCAMPTDCVSGVCGQGVCASATCADGVKNGNETDIDCGGTCSPCATDKSCVNGTDCGSGVCKMSLCVAASCTDGVKNGNESDVDCGGTCSSKCSSGGGCGGNADCVNNVCTNKICAAAACTDKIKNGDETDVDCGGSCPPCGDTLSCKAATDCNSKVCTATKCVTATCSDSVKNGNETDVDCGGGGSCSACGTGKSCGAASDCASLVCTAGKCIAASCTDSIKNGTETDIDCGGSCTTACAIGKGCSKNADCTSNVCTGGVCQMPCNDGSTQALAGTSCLTIQNTCGVTKSGVYYIKPNNAVIQAYCNMDDAGGGWILLLSYDHHPDNVSGSPNMLTRDWNVTTPSDTSDYGRNWAGLIPDTFFGANQAQVMLKRMSDASTRVFTLKQWVGWSVPCNTWNPGCAYTNAMHMYALVNNFPFPNDYYFHACDGPDCHGTNTYYAVGVDCHAPYTSNYALSNSGTMSFSGGDTSNCPTTRNPDLYGFGATSPQQNRYGSWGFANTNYDVGRIAYYVREKGTIPNGCGASPSTAAKSCKALKANSNCSATDGTYWLNMGGPTPFKAYCDMTTSGGGWMLLLSYDHHPDNVSGSPNMLGYEWNTASPSETTDYARDWAQFVPNNFFVNGTSQIRLKRIVTSENQTFTIKQWVGWNTTCNQWNSGCAYTNAMHMYAVVTNPSYQNDYYFHACDGPDCHGTNTYYAVGVDCHAPYTSNYALTNSNTLTYSGGDTANCPSGRNPDLYGFGATTPQQNRYGGWGFGSTNIDIGRVAYYVKE